MDINAEFHAASEAAQRWLRLAETIPFDVDFL